MKTLSCTFFDDLALTDPINFEFFDGLIPRLLATNPAVLPTNAVISGTTLNLKSQVFLTIANFPQRLVGLESLTAVLKPLQKSARLIEVRDLVSCQPLQPDCNRSLIVLETPVVESPGRQHIEVTHSVAGQAARVVVAVVDLDFEPPCDFTRFCQDMRLIENLKTIRDKPSIECSPDYCIDQALISDPAVLQFSPSSGSTSGGTVVTVGQCWL